MPDPNRQPLVSILAACDDGVASVESQDYPELEAVRVEDAPPERRMGVVAAALQQARGDFVMYLPAGDSLLPGAVSKLAEVLIAQSPVALAYPSFNLVDAGGETVETVLPEELDALEMLRLQYAPVGPGALFRRDWGAAALQVEGASARFGELALWVGLAARGPVRRLLAPLASRRVEAGRPAGGADAARERLQAFESLVAAVELPPGSEPLVKSGARSACVLAALELGEGVNSAGERFFVADRFSAQLGAGGGDDHETEVARLEARIANLEQRLSRHRAVIPLIEATVAARESHRPGNAEGRGGALRRRLAGRLGRVADA